MKYLKNTKANLSNVIIITDDFNIRDNNWNPSYLYHSTHADTLSEVANILNLEQSSSINLVSTRYADNLNNYNSIIDLMFLRSDSEEFNSNLIIPDLRDFSDHILLVVSILI